MHDGVGQRLADMTGRSAIAERALRLHHFAYEPWLWSNPDRLELRVVLGDRTAVERALAALGLGIPSAWNGVDELSYDPLPHLAVRVENSALVVIIANADRFDGLEMKHVRAAEEIEAALLAAGVVARPEAPVTVVLGRIFDFTSWDERGWIRLERGEKVRFDASVSEGIAPEVGRWVHVEIVDPKAKQLEARRVTAADPPEPKRYVHRVWPPIPAPRVVEPGRRPWPTASHWPQPVRVEEPLDREAVFAANPLWCDPGQAADLCLAFRPGSRLALPTPLLDPWGESIAAITAAAWVGRPNETSPSDDSARVGAAAVRLVGGWPMCGVCGAAMQLLIALPASTMQALGMPSEELAAFTCPACHVGPWKDLRPSGMVEVRWNRGDEGRLVPHPNIARTRAASGLELVEWPTLPSVGTIRRWIPGGAARELFPNTLVSTQEGLTELDEIWTQWTPSGEHAYGVQIGGYPRWFSGEDRCRACPTCDRPLRMIAWVDEYALSGPTSRERDLVLFACNRSGCDPHRVELSYERDG